MMIVLLKLKTHQRSSLTTVDAFTSIPNGKEDVRWTCTASTSSATRNLTSQTGKLIGHHQTLTTSTTLKSTTTTTILTTKWKWVKAGCHLLVKMLLLMGGSSSSSSIGNKSRRSTIDKSSPLREWRSSAGSREGRVKLRQVTFHLMVRHEALLVEVLLSRVWRLKKEVIKKVKKNLTYLAS